MIDNKLYLFIKDKSELIEADEAKIKFRFEHKKSLSEKNYILCHLPLETKNTKHDLYIQTKHHISFYEDQSDSNPFLSQYHYTAYFTDQEANNYQLHVYFNQKDQLMDNPFFSLETDDKTYKKKNIPEEFSDYLSQIAINETSLYMKKIRKVYNEFLLIFKQNLILQRMNCVSSPKI